MPNSEGLGCFVCMRVCMCNTSCSYGRAERDMSGVTWLKDNQDHIWYLKAN